MGSNGKKITEDKFCTINRYKDNGSILGYIVENGGNEFIPLKDTKLYSPENAIRSVDGAWKAKKGSQIKTITKEQYKGIQIESRKTHLVGKPLLIHSTSYAKLSGTQEKIWSKLENKNMHIFNRSKDSISIDMKDLSALTAFTGLEFSLFERNDNYVVFKGNERGMFISEQDSAMLLNKRYKWIGHTHPGTTFECMMPSGADYNTLKLFKQKSSVVYNSVGDYYVFGLEE